MSTVTFENYRVGYDSLNEIGATADRDGVLSEMSQAFGYDGSNPQELLGEVAPLPTLQDNIEFARDTLSDPALADELGMSGASAGEIAKDWAERSALQAPVYRPLLPESDGNRHHLTASVMTEGVVNWMNRNVATMIDARSPADVAILAYSARTIGASEHPDVEAGTPVKEYMSGILIPKLEAAGLFRDVILVGTDESTKGDDVMNALALEVSSFKKDVESQVLMNAVAGNWIQKGVQFRQAMRNIWVGFDADRTQSGRELWVASDSFALGVTGEESKTTHQNPFSALGNILRGMKLLQDLEADLSR